MYCRGKFITRFIFSLILLFLIVPLALADNKTLPKNESATSNKVYALTEDTLSELKLIHMANFSEMSPDEPYQSERMPRHILQKSQEIHTKIQKLKMLKGLNYSFIETFPVKNIQMNDVEPVIQSILADIRQLKPTFYVTEKIQPCPLPQHTETKDIYRNLAQITKSIDTLDILPRLASNELHRIALTITDDLGKLLKAKHVFTEKQVTKPASNKTVRDGYDKLRVLLTKLQDLVNQPGYKIQGEVVMPSKKTGEITRSDNLELMNIALADIGAIKYATGVNQPTEFPPMQVGKNPTTVYMTIEQSITMIDALFKGKKS